MSRKQHSHTRAAPGSVGLGRMSRVFDALKVTGGPCGGPSIVAKSAPTPTALPSLPAASAFLPSSEPSSDLGLDRSVPSPFDPFAVSPSSPFDPSFLSRHLARLSPGPSLAFRPSRRVLDLLRPPVAQSPKCVVGRRRSGIRAARELGREADAFVGFQTFRSCLPLAPASCVCLHRPLRLPSNRRRPPTKAKLLIPTPSHPRSRARGSRVVLHPRLGDAGSSRPGNPHCRPKFRASTTSFPFPQSLQRHRGEGRGQSRSLKDQGKGIIITGIRSDGRTPVVNCAWLRQPPKTIQQYHQCSRPSSVPTRSHRS